MSRCRGALTAFGHGSAQYRDANRAVRSAIRQDTREDVERRIREGRRGSMWKLIRPVVGSKRAARKLPGTAPDNLNRYFVSVGPRVADEVKRLGPTPDINCRLPRVGACALVLAPLSLAELRVIVFGMSSTRACGDDGVSIQMIRTCFDAVGWVLLHLVNSSITQSDVPESWKHSLVHPIHKSGNHSDPSNFRPISIVPVIAKIVERAVHQQLYSTPTYLKTTSSLPVSTVSGLVTRPKPR